MNDTAGNKIFTPLGRCPAKCGSTGGCLACMPYEMPKQPEKEDDCDCKYEWVLVDGICGKCEKRFYDTVLKRKS
jgi:hypothetical protein